MYVWSVWSELGGAVGDLGTYIPIVLALSLASHHDLGPPRPCTPCPVSPTFSSTFARVSSVHLSFIMEQEEAARDRKHAVEAVEKKDEVVIPVKLDKFRSQASTEGGATISEGCSVNPSQDVRRCYSIGTYEYVMDEISLLHVSVKPLDKKRPTTRMPGHCVAMSECDCNSKREGFHGFDALPKQPPPSKVTVDKRERFSISKIWMRGGLRRKDSAIIASSCSTSRHMSSSVSPRCPSAR
ncbi:RING-H2 finger protein ATL13-like [Phragmites australis]|uniref:RING-H2 finger protein ATL13-like n=1 Tax=Phragmites australis TaxID=29695 RepID=UPI002D78BD60|nr:RING-H2 finger protein ATL13-like [Phragmites australis]